MLSFLVTLIIFTHHICTGRIHGGTFMAAAGRDAIVLAVDSRHSSQQSGPFLLDEHPRRIIRVGSKCFIACFGLESDVDDLAHKLRQKLLLHSDAKIEPENVARCVANILYSSNMICSPIVVGFGTQGPYICSMDSIGAQTVTDKFAVIGTASAALYSACEGRFICGMDTAKLERLVEECMQSVLARDVMSGCAVRLHTITKEGGMTTRDVSSADV